MPTRCVKAIFWRENNRTLRYFYLCAVVLQQRHNPPTLDAWRLFLFWLRIYSITCFHIHRLFPKGVTNIGSFRTIWGTYTL